MVEYNNDKNTHIFSSVFLENQENTSLSEKDHICYTVSLVI